MQEKILGVQTLWFQAVCQNHIVGHAVEVADFSRERTANMHEAVADVRSNCVGWLFLASPAPMPPTLTRRLDPFMRQGQ